MAYSDFGMSGSLAYQIPTTFVDEIREGDKGYARGPVRALMSALLFDGVQSFMSYSFLAKKGGGKRYREAYNWITDSTNTYIFSFNSVCEALGIDPEWLRYGLINAANSNDTDFRKARRTS